MRISRSLLTMIRLFEGAKHTEAYASFRPQTPLKVAEIMMNYLKKRMPPSSSGLYQKMLDVGCGSGQSVKIFSPYFETLVGIDPSSNQIEMAKKNINDAKILFDVGFGEDIKFGNESVDLITTCQAIHWMDFQKFFNECHRTLKPDGCLLVHGYDRPRIFSHSSNKIKLDCAEAGNRAEKAFKRFYAKCKFHPRRTHIDDHYSRVFDSLQSDHKTKDESVTIQKTCSLADFISYIDTWSGYIKYLEDAKKVADGKVENILDIFIQTILQEWGLVGHKLDEINVDVIWNVFMIMSERPMFDAS